MRTLRSARLRPGDSSTLCTSPLLRNLTDHLRDLITIAFEASCNRPSNYLALTKLEYVSDEKHADKFSMHFAARVRDHGQIGDVPLRVTFTVEEDREC